MGRENHERCSKKNIPKIGGYLIMIIENKIGGGAELQILWWGDT